MFNALPASRIEADHEGDAGSYDADERLAAFEAFPDAVWANDADLGPMGSHVRAETERVRVS